MTDVEITVRRVGPAREFTDGSRLFGPRVFPLRVEYGNQMQGVQLNGTDIPGLWDLVYLNLFSFEPINDDGWFGGRMLLEHRGVPIGSPRPFLFFGGPCDVPMYTMFESPNYGAYQVGLRAADFHR